MLTNFTPPVLLLLSLPLSWAFSMNIYIATSWWIHLVLHVCDSKTNHLVLDNLLGSYSMWGDFFSHGQQSLVLCLGVRSYKFSPATLNMSGFAASQRLKVALVLKTPCTSDKGFRGPKLNWKSPPWGLAFIETEVAMQATKGEKQTVILPSYEDYEPWRWPAWQDIPNGAMLAFICWQSCENPQRGACSTLTGG